METTIPPCASTSRSAPSASLLAAQSTLMGFDFDRGRIDDTAHPFMTTFASNDVRITVRADERFLGEHLFSAMHEAGHALYELGVDPAFEGTPLGDGASNGMHESQSRLWENFVGRGLDFWEGQYAHLQAAFPDQLGRCRWMSSIPRSTTCSRR